MSYKIINRRGLKLMSAKERCQGLMKKLASSSVHGTAAEKLPASILWKYRFFWDMVVKRTIVFDD